MSKYHGPAATKQHGRWTGSTKPTRYTGNVDTRGENEYYLIHVNSPIRKRLRRSRHKTEYDTTYETYGEWYDPDVWNRVPRADTGCSWIYSEERILGGQTKTGNVEYGNFYNKLSAKKLKQFTDIKRFPRQTGIPKTKEEQEEEDAKIEAMKAYVPPEPVKTKRRKWTVVETKPICACTLPAIARGETGPCKCNGQCSCKCNVAKPKANPTKKVAAIDKQEKLPQIDQIHIGLQLKDGSTYNIKALPENAVYAAE